MQEQQECYGIPYAMVVHDIESIEAFWENHDNVNERLQLGWVLLKIESNEDADLLFVMGVPRPQFCIDTRQSPNSHPKRALKEWNHQRKEWQCRWCIEDDAHQGNERFNNPTKPW